MRGIIEFGLLTIWITVMVTLTGTFAENLAQVFATAARGF
jgi:hypothetical protein